MTTDNHHQQLADDALQKYDKESNAFEHTGFMAKFVSALAICFSVFQLYTAVFGVLDAQLQRAVHLGFGLALVFLLYPTFSKAKEKGLHILDYVLAFLGAAAPACLVIAYKELVRRVFRDYRPAVVVNLAAQAGVRYSIDHPDAYIESNLIGFFQILEACRAYPVEHLVYASSSSVYGGNKKVPFSVEDKVDHPVSLYAATKKSDELLAHSYAKLYSIPSTGLRFFTVYGPAGRPDMFYYSATRRLAAGQKIRIFNFGNMMRDFTYIDDIVEGILRVMRGAPETLLGEDGLPLPPYAIYNIGGGQPENLLDFVATLQEELVRAGILPEDYDFEGHRELVGMQPGDVPVTYADSSALEEDYGFRPSIGIREGLRAFARWYKDYYAK